MIATAIIVGVVFGHFAGGYVFWQAERQKHVMLATLAGGLFGGLLVYIVSGASFLIQNTLLSRQLHRVNGRIKNAIKEATEKYEEDLENQSGTPEARLHLAIAHLLQDEVEKSVQEFHQAQKLGATESLFFNNAGVALARRGSVVQSVEMFQRAIAMNGHKGQPHVNLSHAFLYAVADEEHILIERALEEIDRSIQEDGERPVHFNRKGLVLLRAGRYDDAILAFRKAMDVGMDYDGLPLKLVVADGHTNLGLAQFAKHDIRNTIMQFRLALKADDGGHGRAMSNLGVMHLLQGDDAEALYTLQNAAALDPRSAPVRNNLGYALWRGRTINEALREFREATLCDPAFFEAYYNMGKLYLDEGLLDVAERNLMRAYQLNSRSWEVLVALGVARMKQANWGQAIQMFTQADRVSPNQPLIMLNLATCIALDGDYPRAQEILERAVEIDEVNGDVHAQLGWVYLLQLNVAMCANQMSVAIHHNPRVATYHNNLGLCLTGRNDYDLAVASLRQAQSLDPQYFKVNYHLGYVYAIQNKIDQAIKEWEVTTKEESKFIDVHVNLGVAYFKQGSYEKAVDELKRVIAARQDRMEDFSNLGLALAKHGVDIRKASRTHHDAKYKESIEKHSLAVDMFDRALVMEPNNVLLHSNRGLACFFANQAEEAVKEWGMVTKLDPGYARRRGKTMQTEFDESAIMYVPLDILERSDRVAPRTADLLYRLAPGYDTEEWAFIIDDQTLTDIPNLTQSSRHIERKIKALKV